MSNIIGESFDDYVKTQVDVRQKVLGLTNRRPEDLVYLNSKTAWLRLASSVDIGGQYFINTNPIPELQNLTDDKLARKFVLFGGTSDGGKNLATGSFGAKQSNIFDNQTYGLGGIEDYGFKPMAGLNSAKITSYNRGSLRKATIKITANNPQQFYIIDTLYMKLGYTVLLEWGWTIYKDNKGVNQTAPNDNAFNSFLKGTTFNSVLTGLENIRISTSCNQDGFIGYVTNFRWNYNQDGLYDIEIDVVSIGSVIESLNINKVYPFSTLLTANSNTISSQTIAPSGVSTSPSEILAGGEYVRVLSDVVLPTLESKAIKNKLINFLFYCERRLDEDAFFKNLWKIPLIKNTPTTSTPITGPAGVPTGPTGLTGAVGASGQLSGTNLTIYELNTYSFIDKKYKDTPIFGYKPLNPDGSTRVDDGIKRFYYIKLGALLDYINKELVIYSSSNNEKIEVIKIDTSLNSEFYLPPLSLSGDPDVCIVPFIYYDGINYKEWEDNTTYTYDVKSKDKLAEGFKGNLMHLWVGLDFIKNLFPNSENENSEVFLYNFLENLMLGINKALGGINKFEIIYDEVRNLVKIIELTNIPGNKFKTSLINVSGVYPNDKGSFVKNITLNSELSNQMASMVAIGAQAQGIKIPQDSTAFSKWYEGLKDRIIPYKLDSSEEVVKGTSPIQSSNDIEVQLYDKYPENIQKLIELITNVYDTQHSTDETINSLRSINSELTQYRNGLFVQNDVIGIQGFIPLNMNLTLEGISGMKIYQKFNITQDILPPLYPKKLNFLIRGIDHEIDRSGWRTNIQTFATGTDQDINTSKLNIKAKLNILVGSVNDADLLNTLRKGQLLFAYLIKKWQEAGYIVDITSAFRDVKKQQEEYDKWVAGGKKGPRPVDPSKGNSNHSRGSAIDVNLFKGPEVLNSQTLKSIWQNSEALKISNSLGFRWGGTFIENYDPIHFDMGINESEYKKINEIIAGKRVNGELVGGKPDYDPDLDLSGLLSLTDLVRP